MCKVDYTYIYKNKIVERNYSRMLKYAQTVPELQISDLPESLQYYKLCHSVLPPLAVSLNVSLLLLDLRFINLPVFCSQVKTKTKKSQHIFHFEATIGTEQPP